MNRHRSTPRLAAAAATGMALVAVGCTVDAAPTTADRAGNAGPTVLRFATIDSVNGGGEREFINSVSDVSGGRLMLEVVSEYGDAAADAESALVRAVVDGSVDMGIAATRAYDRAGIPGLQALETPLLLDSDPAVLEVVDGSVGRQILSGLEDHGLVGLALLHSGLRRPFAADAPLVSLEDWQGVRFRVYNSPVQAAAVAALGATPVDESYQWVDAVRAGELDGGEFSIQDMVDFNPGDGIDFGTPNVVLWPKVETIIIGQRLWDDLTEVQRDWLTTAAERAIGANIAVDREESAAVEQMCQRGMRFVPAGVAQLEALDSALAPVRGVVADDPDEAPLLTSLEEVAARHASTSVPDVPVACQDPVAKADVEEAAAQEPIPDGVYRMTATQAELIEKGINNGPGWSGTWTMTVTDGVYSLTCAPAEDPGKDCGNFDGPADQVLESGPLVPVPGGVQLAYDLDPASDLSCDGCADSDGYQVRWTLDGKKLVLKHLSGQSGDEAYQWTVNPWTKID